MASPCPGNAIGEDEAADIVCVKLRGPVSSQSLICVGGKTNLGKNRTVRTGNTEFRGPIGPVCRAGDIVVVNPIQANIQMVQQRRAEEMIEANAIVVRYERMAEGAAIERNREVGSTINRLLISFGKGKEELVSI